jgi:hypothetical protein
VHDALQAFLSAAFARQIAALAEPQRAAMAAAVAVSKERASKQQEVFLEDAWLACEQFLRSAQPVYLRFAAREQDSAANPALLRAAFRQRVRAAMRLPVVESFFAQPWPAAARRVLPTSSPRLTATALWGPVLAWIALELLAESIDREDPGAVALDLYDRLRLREPLANAFAALGFEHEEGWRVAGRIKVLLLTQADVGQPELALVTPLVGREALGLWRNLWADADLRWLTGVHETEGCEFLVKEQYEELLWWLRLPALLKLAAAPKAAPVELDAIRAAIAEALGEAEAAGYRLDRLLASVAEAMVQSKSEPSEAEALESPQTAAGKPAVEDEDATLHPTKQSAPAAPRQAKSPKRKK